MCSAILATTTFDPDRFLSHFNHCIEDAVVVARGNARRGGLGKYIGQNYARALQKVMTQQIALRPAQFDNFLRDVLKGRIDDARIEHLRAYYTVYWADQTLRKSYRNGQKTLPTFTDGVAHLVKVLPRGFDIPDLASGDMFPLLCDDLIEAHRAQGNTATAVTNLLHILAVVGSARFALSDADRATRMAQLACDGLLPAYQGGNIQVLDILETAVERSLRLSERHDHLARRVLLTTIRHMRADFQGNTGEPTCHRHAFEALDLVKDSPTHDHTALCRVQRLSVHHNALKGYSESGVDSTTSVEIDGKRGHLSDHLARVTEGFKDIDHKEGAALGQLTVAKLLMRQKLFGDAERTLLSGLQIVKPTPRETFLTANAALCEGLGDLNALHIDKPDYAHQCYQSAKRGYQRAGSYQRGERVARKLRRLA